MKKNFVLFAMVAMISSFGSSAFAESLDSWTYFDGASRTVQSKDGWIQLESKDKNYCNGRVRLQKESDSIFFGARYVLEIQGSWCKVVKFGYSVDGDRYNETSFTQRFALKYSNDSSAGWVGYGGTFYIPEASLFTMSNGVSPSQMSMVAYTDSRDDTHKRAYEKLTINLSSFNQAPPSDNDVNACINDAKSYVADKLGVSKDSLSVDNAHLSAHKNYVYDVHYFFSTRRVTTDQSCKVLSYQRI
jgi:hypothetical protein